MCLEEDERVIKEVDHVFGTERFEVGGRPSFSGAHPPDRAAQATPNSRLDEARIQVLQLLSDNLDHFVQNTLDLVGLHVFHVLELVLAAVFGACAWDAITAHVRRFVGRGQDLDGSGVSMQKYPISYS